MLPGRWRDSNCRSCTGCPSGTLRQLRLLELQLRDSRALSSVLHYACRDIVFRLGIHRYGDHVVCAGMPCRRHGHGNNARWGGLYRGSSLTHGLGVCCSTAAARGALRQVFIDGFYGSVHHTPLQRCGCGRLLGRSGRWLRTAGWWWHRAAIATGRQGGRTVI